MSSFLELSLEAAMSDPTDAAALLQAGRAVHDSSEDFPLGRVRDMHQTLLLQITYSRTRT